MTRPKQEFYALANTTTGEVMYFASLTAISLHLGKSKSWASYILRKKDGKYKHYQIMIGDMFENMDKDNIEA